MHILKESTQLVVIFPNVPLSYCSCFFCTAFVPNYYLLRLVVCPLLSGMTHCTNVLWWYFNLFMMTLFLPLPMGKIKLSHSSSGLLQLHTLSVWCLSQLAYWWSRWLWCILVCIPVLLAFVEFTSFKRKPRRNFKHHREILKDKTVPNID